MSEADCLHLVPRLRMSGLIHLFLLFYVHGTLHRNSMSINVQQDATIHSLSVNCSTCFGSSLHPSSGVQITVSTASGTSQPLLLPVAIVEELRSLSWRSWHCSLNSPTIAAGSNNGWLVPDAVGTFICAPDDGWRDHPKHVEQFTDKINCV